MDRLNIKELKTELRTLYKEKRKELPQEEKQRMDKAICDRFLSLSSYRYADTILLYYPLKNEIDTRRIALDALEKGKRLAFPRCIENNEMVYHYVTSLDELTSGKYGINEPKEDLPLYVPSADSHALCVLPAIIYDKKGYRLGYGKGYYDRFLSSFKGTKAGLIYSDFIIDEIPHGRYDLRADVVITEKGVIPFAKN